MEKTLVLIKPDGVERKLIGEIISFYERKNLNISALKMIKANKKAAEAHYVEHAGRDYYNSLIDYITDGKIVAMVIEGENAVKIVRKINGVTDPIEADMGSIRGKYGLSKERNLVHASDSIENAKREISIWFPEI
ncbi:Nucleoside diphosphate kinase [Clostridium liquoris]|jgi:nucleoside-diphosphate kinase|uniref:Nucleoside diphosphate kinase n=1 Tax=Clostridium liquoris TaxID=1289519 RepID=A0A2T0B153_9CLOT|nr:nucleoside-diphosphate kinase [Clostridium liquoris]PRR77340.1 Nucleoside diphosphate kinase [Clostridium liquoris]